ncbi:glycophorin-C-like [Pseudorasbora parva]|uniref:glycophorin-C-like n=1 Tax=Pseudorasbora parva TaxID=51549 RepID=UPI00351E2502
MEDLNVTSPSVPLTEIIGDYIISPDPALLTTVPVLQVTTLHNATYVAPIADQSEQLILLGVSVIAVVVMILLMMIVVLRYLAHQKGTYYTNEEALAFKSNPEVQDALESPEDPDEEEP